MSETTILAAKVTRLESTIEDLQKVLGAQNRIVAELGRDMEMLYKALASVANGETSRDGDCDSTTP